MKSEELKVKNEELFAKRERSSTLECYIDILLMNDANATADTSKLQLLGQKIILHFKFLTLNF